MACTQPPQEPAAKTGEIGVGNGRAQEEHNAKMELLRAQIDHERSEAERLGAETEALRRAEGAATTPSPLPFVEPPAAGYYGTTNDPGWRRAQDERPTETGNRGFVENPRLDEEARKQNEAERQRRAESPDEYESRLRQIQGDYREARRGCPDWILAGDDQIIVDKYGNEVGRIHNRNTQAWESAACAEKIDLLTQYTSTYQKLLAVAPERVIAGDIPSKLR